MEQECSKIQQEQGVQTGHETKSVPTRRRSNIGIIDSTPMKLFVQDTWSGKVYHVNTVSEAQKITKLGARKIRQLLETGQKWKGWIVDEDF